MKIPKFWLLSLGLIFVTNFILAGISTSLWFLVFGRLPAPHFWLVSLAYVSVTRPLWEATLMAYGLSLVNSGFTALSFEAFLVYSLLLTVVLILIRERVFWGGSSFFMLMVGAASLSSPILFWITSRYFEANPLVWPDLFAWLLASLFNLLASVPLYHLFRRFDHLALLDAGAEGRVGPR